MRIFNQYRMKLFRRFSNMTNHIFREANQCADILAGMGHFGGFQWTILYHTLFQLSLALQADAR